MPAAEESSLISVMAHCLSTGTSFLGISIDESVRCLYLDRENGVSVVQERFNRLHITDSDDFKYWFDNGFGVGGPDDARIVKWLAYSQRKTVIFIDSFIAFFEGKESDAPDVRAFFSLLRKLTRMGAAVVFLHHTGKGPNTKDYRGSSDIKAAVDVAFLLTNTGSSRLEKLELTSFKSRFTVIEKLVFHYEDGNFSPDVMTEEREFQLAYLLYRNPTTNKSDFEVLAGTAIDEGSKHESLSTRAFGKKPSF